MHSFSLNTSLNLIAVRDEISAKCSDASMIGVGVFLLAFLRPPGFSLTKEIRAQKSIAGFSFALYAR